MEIQCPHCAAKFFVEVFAESNYSDNEQFIINNFFQWLKGHKSYKGQFKKLNYHEFEFRVQLDDSPEGDTWAHGVLEWTPGYKLEIKEMKLSYQ